MKNPFSSKVLSETALSLLPLLLFLLPASGGADSFDLLQDREITVGGNILDIALSGDGKWTFVLTDTGEVAVLDQAGRTTQRISVGQGYSRLEYDQGSGRLLLGGDRGSLKVLTLAMRYEIDISGSPYRGPEKAPVTIAVFTDYQ